MTTGIRRFDFRVIAWLCLAAGLTLIPFALLHAVKGDPMLTLLSVSLAVLLNGVAYRIWKRGRVNTALLYAGLISTNLIVLSAIHTLGASAVYWAYPVVAANLIFMHPRRGAMVNALFMATVLLLANRWVPVAELGRIAASLIILTTCVYFFSLYITQQQTELRALAALDPLTGAGNRRALQESLEEIVASLQRYGCSASLLMLDLDHFKRVNDTLGHDHGDRLLRDVVSLLQRRLRSADRVFRFGGEEFVIVAPHTPLTMATRLAEDIRHTIAETRHSGHPVTVSLGVVELQPDESAEQWLKRGDQALYQAKSLGRNRAVAVGECSGTPHHPGQRVTTPYHIV